MVTAAIRAVIEAAQSVECSPPALPPYLAHYRESSSLPEWLICKCYTTRLSIHLLVTSQSASVPAPAMAGGYKEETTEKGAMKIEVVLEEARKKKKERPGSASSIRNFEGSKHWTSMSLSEVFSWSNMQPNTHSESESDRCECKRLADIEARQKAAEERRRLLESSQLTQLAEKRRKAEEVRAKKALLGEAESQ